MGCTESKPGPPQQQRAKQAAPSVPAKKDECNASGASSPKEPVHPEVLVLPEGDSVAKYATVDIAATASSTKELETLYPQARQQYIQSIQPALQGGATLEDLSLYHDSAVEEDGFGEIMKKIEVHVAAALIAEHSIHLQNLLNTKYGVEKSEKDSSSPALFSRKIRSALDKWAAERAVVVTVAHFKAVGARLRENGLKRERQSSVQRVFSDTESTLDNSSVLHRSRRGPQKRVRLPSVKGSEVVIKKNVLYLVVADGTYESMRSGVSHEVYGFNASTDQQITLRAKFDAGADARPGKEVTLDSDGYFALVIMPCETILFVRGKFPNGLTFLDCMPTYAPINNANALRVRHDMSKLAISDDMTLLSSSLPSITFEAPMNDAPGTGSAQAVAAHCTEQEVPFVDPFFPPLLSSLYSAQGDTTGWLPVPWSRPKGFIASSAIGTVTPTEASPMDIEEGALGDGWLVSAFAILAERPYLLGNVFRNAGPDGAHERSLGIHRVRLCTGGVWREGVVDDYLPCAGKVPLYARNKNPSELWVALLEKAYAKSQGCYKSIVRGDTADALTELAGFPVLKFDQEGSLQASMWDEIRSVSQTRRGLLFFGTEGLTDSDREQSGATIQLLAQMSLCPGYSYCVHRTEEEKVGGRVLRLFLIRAPWGAGKHTGTWCHSSPRWAQHPELAARCDVSADDAEQGLRWMDFDECVVDAPCFVTAGLLHTPPGDDVRFNGHLLHASGLMDFVLKVTVTTEIEMTVSVHQESGRSNWSDDPVLAALRCVVLKAKDDGHMEVKSYSHPTQDEDGELDGIFSPCANISAMPVTLSPGVYYVMGEGCNVSEEVEANKTKEVVLGLQVSPQGSGTEIVALTTTEAMAASLQMVDFHGFLSQAASVTRPTFVQYNSVTVSPCPTTIKLE